MRVETDPSALAAAAASESVDVPEFTTRFAEGREACTFTAGLDTAFAANFGFGGGLMRIDPGILLVFFARFCWEDVEKKEKRDLKERRKLKRK
jgi:hypothetical protein